MTVTRGRAWRAAPPLSVTKEFAISAVRSVEASSTTMISKSIPVCVTSESRQSERHDSSFLAGTMTETPGLGLLVMKLVRC